ncbi:hypothetical protein [Actinacidiphila acididurans]|uniref:Uncharacterized protein n=1 Tax=Actinacidiphila acididurans TaxID=2784346 RepID=A0ABS2U3M6_9ACTN|nr:hypothetical protein [Actinacidiphila acididurans]MBM9509937.1 hypothetical protein [Actinacidiphila acididurans]
MPEENTTCTLCGHHADQHNLNADGYRPCRSAGHPDGLNCRECIRLTSGDHLEQLIALRNSDDPAFTAAWSAFTVTRDHARHEIGDGWQAFYTDVHQSALASAILTYRAQQEEETQALRDRVAELEAAVCRCFSAEMHDPACSQSRIVVDGVEYSAAHWYADRDGGLWLPYSTDDRGLWLLADGDRHNEAVMLSEVISEYGPLTRTEHTTDLSIDEIHGRIPKGGEPW